MDAELLERLDRMIVLEKKCLSKFAEGTFQHSQDADFWGVWTLLRVEAILHKTAKARGGHVPDCRAYKLLDPMVRDTKEERVAILWALER